MVQGYPGLTGVWERDAIEKHSLKLEDVCHSFQALRLCLTWSQVSRSITSPGLRSSWVKSVISVTVNRPVLLEHSKRRDWTSRISCSLQYSPCRGAELLGNHLQFTSLGGRGSQTEGMLWSCTFCHWRREFSLPAGPRTQPAPGPRPLYSPRPHREVRPAPWPWPAHPH